ncbi:MAG: DHA2 family efflux MFS transporter permease subunit [Desulfobacteraceae bacterium]|nr:MAG: DHA2 family efflux MFS transporter permease subunit [Desulfobacteraceae bacterium]
MNPNDANKWTALIVSTLSSFMTPFMGSSINIALPSIAQTFGIDAVTLSWIATSYLLAAAVALVPLGRLADIYGRKKIYLYGTILFTVASLCCGLSASPLMLIIFRVLQGLGNAMVFATGIAMLISVFPPQDRGKVLGINVAVVYIGLSIGPVLGGFLTQTVTWRGIFLINIPLGLIIIFLVLTRLKGEWAEARGEKYDYPGALLYSLAILALMYGISLLPALSSLWWILSGIAGFIFFILHENRVTHPVFELKLFRNNRVFAFSNLAALINYSATFALTFLLSLYFQYIKGYSPTQTGFILIAQPVSMVLISLLAGWLSDKKEPRLLATIGMILTAIGLFLFAFLQTDTPPSLIVADLVLLGCGFGFFSSPNTNAIMGCIEKRYYGIASGSIGTMRLLGMLISMGIATTIFTLYLGRVRITPEYFPAFLNGTRVAFIIFGVLCFGGIFASFVRGKVHGRTAQPCA